MSRLKQKARVFFTLADHHYGFKGVRRQFFDGGKSLRARFHLEVEFVKDLRNRASGLLILAE